MACTVCRLQINLDELQSDGDIDLRRRVSTLVGSTL